VSVQQRPGDLGAGHGPLIRNRAVAPEHHPQEALDGQGEAEWNEEQQPDGDGHGPAVPYGRPTTPAEEGACAILGVRQLTNEREGFE
jgi:hypothetical protein